MANTIEYAKVFQNELDRAAVQKATSGWMELNSDMVKYNGGNEVKIPSIVMDGLADYDRDNGFVDGTVDLKWETQTMTMDRARRFTIDENDVDETNFVLTAATMMGEFQRKQVVPEIDAYRYSTLAAKGITAKHASGGYIPTAKDIYSKLLYDIAQVQDVVGDDEPLIITMSMTAAMMLDLADETKKILDTSNFTKGDVTLKVKSLNGQHPIIRVGGGRFKTKYIFNDGKTSGQEKGGFAAATDAQDINWIICPADTAIAVSKTDNMRIFDPNTYQKKRAWAMDYRKFHDLWVPKNKVNNIFVNVQQSLPTEG